MMAKPRTKSRPHCSLPQFSVRTCTFGIPGWEDVMNGILVVPS
jgi:hypothetical protein